MFLLSVFFSLGFFYKEGAPRITSIRKFTRANNPLDTATAGSVYIQSCDVPISALLRSDPALPPLLKAKIAVPAPQPSMAPRLEGNFHFPSGCSGQRSFSFRARKDYYVEGNVRFPSGLEKIITCVFRWVLPLSFFCSFSTLEAVTFLLHTCANKSTKRETCFLETFIFFYGFESQGEERKVETAPSVSSAADLPPLVFRFEFGYNKLMLILFCSDTSTHVPPSHP